MNTWAKLIEEVFAYERRSIIDDYGGLDFLRKSIKARKSQKDTENEFGVSTRTIQRYLKSKGYNWTKFRKELNTKYLAF